MISQKCASAFRNSFVILKYQQHNTFSKFKLIFPGCWYKTSFRGRNLKTSGTKNEKNTAHSADCKDESMGSWTCWNQVSKKPCTAIYKGLSPNSACKPWANLSELVNFYSPRNYKRTYVFLLFQRKYSLLKFAQRRVKFKVIRSNSINISCDTWRQYLTFEESSSLILKKDPSVEKIIRFSFWSVKLHFYFYVKINEIVFFFIFLITKVLWLKYKLHG